MSTMLQGQLVAWRVAARPRVRVSLVGVVRIAVIAAAVAASTLYLATMAETPAVVSGLIREASSRRESEAVGADERPSPVVVTLRPSAGDERLLQP